MIDNRRSPFSLPIDRGEGCFQVPDELEPLASRTTPEAKDRFRYRLRFVVNPDGTGRMGVIGFNPSYATKAYTDKTVDFYGAAIAHRLGFKELEILNLFPIRSSIPALVFEADLAEFERINDGHITQALPQLDLLLVAWGDVPKNVRSDAEQVKKFEKRVSDVKQLIQKHAGHLTEVSKVRALQLNTTGHPRHLGRALVLPSRIEDLPEYPVRAPGHHLEGDASGSWQVRLYDRVCERGYDSLTAFAEAHPTASLEALAKELGEDDSTAGEVSQGLLEGLVDEAKQSDQLTRLVRGYLVRELSEGLPDGWPSVMDDINEFRVEKALGRWSAFSPETHQEYVAQVISALRASPPPPGWRPLGLDDELLRTLWPDEEA